MATHIMQRKGGVVGTLVDQSLDAHLPLLPLSEDRRGQNLIHYPNPLAGREVVVMVFAPKESVKETATLCSLVRY